MSALTLALLIGCDEPPPPAAPPADLSGEPASLQECIAQSCPDALTAPASLLKCRQTTCAAVPPEWSLSPSTVRYSEGILSVEVAVEHTPGGHGGATVPHQGEVWLGVTVLTEDGSDIDLAVQTVFPDRLDEPFLFTSEVGEGVRDIIFGLWGTRIEPCDVARSGCQMFGFVLDDSLAAWPPLTYTERPARRQRILPGDLTLQVLSAGATAAETQARAGELEQALRDEGARFGAGVEATHRGLAPAAIPGITVRHRNDHDGPIATIIAPPGAVVSHDSEADADFVVTLGGPPERLACMQEQCPTLADPCDCP